MFCDNESDSDGDVTMMDELLQRATQVLKERSSQQMQQQLHHSQSSSSTISNNQRKQPAQSLTTRISEALRTVKLSPGISNTPAYLVEKSASGTGVVKLDPSRMEIVEEKTISTDKDHHHKSVIIKNSSSEKKKGKKSQSQPATTAEKEQVEGQGVIDKVVIKKSIDKVLPGLDHDAKTKKKMVKETAGPGWFNMPAAELTDDVKKDLLILRSRGALDPKRFYRKQDANKPIASKFFQVGTIENGPTDFYTGRLARKERRSRIVEEVLADYKTNKFLKRKFSEIQKVKSQAARKPTMKKRRRDIGAKGGRINRK